MSSVNQKHNRNYIKYSTTCHKMFNFRSSTYVVIPSRLGSLSKPQENSISAVANPRTFAALNLKNIVRTEWAHIRSRFRGLALVWRARVEHPFEQPVGVLTNGPRHCGHGLKFHVLLACFYQGYVLRSHASPLR